MPAAPGGDVRLAFLSSILASFIISAPATAGDPLTMPAIEAVEPSTRIVAEVNGPIRISWRIPRLPEKPENWIVDVALDGCAFGSYRMSIYWARLDDDPIEIDWTPTRDFRESLRCGKGGCDFPVLVRLIDTKNADPSTFGKHVLCKSVTGSGWLAQAKAAGSIDFGPAVARARGEIALVKSLLAAENPRRWKTYRNDPLGISLRHPSSMTVHTGAQARFQGTMRFWPPQPDVRFSLPVPYEETHVGLADVAIFADLREDCAQPGDEEKGHQVLAGRRFRRFLGGDGATGHWSQIDGFRTNYRGKCFAIVATLQGFRYDEARTPKQHERTEKLRGAIQARLLQVIRTLQFLEPSKHPLESK